MVLPMTQRRRDAPVLLPGRPTRRSPCRAPSQAPELPDRDGFAWQVLSAHLAGAVHGRAGGTFIVSIDHAINGRRLTCRKPPAKRRTLSGPSASHAAPVRPTSRVLASPLLRAEPNEPPRATSWCGCTSPLVEHCARRFRNRGEPLRGPGAGRHDRADQVRRPVRHRARRGVLDVRDADDHRRDQAPLPRQGLGDPGAAPAPGAADADQHRQRGADPGAGPLAHDRASSPSGSGARSRTIIEGLESSNAYSTLSLDAGADSDDGPPAMLETMGIDDAGLEHVETARVDQAAARPAAGAREADPAAAVLQEHDPVADRRRGRGLADARLPAADPDARARCAQALESRAEPSARSSGWRSSASASMLAGCRTRPSTIERDDQPGAIASRVGAPPQKLNATPELDQLGQHDRAARPRGPSR